MRPILVTRTGWVDGRTVFGVVGHLSLGFAIARQPRRLSLHEHLDYAGRPQGQGRYDL